MTLESLRSLLYPLGFLATLVFSARMILQWLQSEKQKKSVVTPLFWKLSLGGNALLMAHAFVQLQFPLCLIQTFSGVIAWRNLNLMGKRPYALRTTLAIATVALLLITLAFLSQGNVAWMRAPFGASAPSSLWHAIGLSGMVLFSSRFWIQWWLAEKNQKSFLGRSFWWISLIGASLSVLYFCRLGDPVNILGYGCGLLPYARNLILSKKPLQSSPAQLFFVAGEQSGDVLGGHLIAALKQRDPTLTLAGVGGPQMRELGMRCPVPMESLQVMGVLEVVRALPKILQRFRQIKREILQANPKAVVMIDYPDFNMLLARSLRKKGYQGKLIHYVCPSVWAWRKGRVKPLAKRLNHLLCILPFEKECFAHTSLPVTYVGHPLIRAIQTHSYETSWNLDGTRFLALFPGSRFKEIKRNLPLQLEAAAKFDLPVAISVAHPQLESEIRKLAPKARLVPGHLRYELMQASDLALATCGTVILELGLHRVPTVVTYKIPPFDYFLGRYVIRLILPSYNLVNLISGYNVFPEFVHADIRVDEVASAMKRLLADPLACQTACDELIARLASSDPSQHAAETILMETA